MFIRYDKVKGTYHVLSRKVAPVSQLSTRWLLRCLLEVRHYAEGTLLDIGCGEKPYRELFNARRHIGGDWPGSEHSARQVDVSMDAVRLPFASGSFESVLMTEVLEHVAEPQAAVVEIARVLKPGGHLILTVPFFYLVHESPHDYFRYTPFGLHRLLEAGKFRIIHEGTRGGALTVAADTCSRAASMVLSQSLKKAGMKPGAVQPVLYWSAGVWQILAAKLLFACYHYLPKLARFIDPANRMTLGYVVVAKRT